MSRIAVVASVVALAGAGYAVVKTGCGACARDALEGRVRALEDAPSLADRVAALERAAAERAEPERLVRVVRPTPDDVAAPTLAARAPVQGPTPTEGETSAAPTLAELAKRIASLEEHRSVRFGRGADGLPPGLRVPGGPRVLTSLDDAVAELELSGGQRADWQRAIDDAQRDLKELRSIPDAEGTTWDDVRKEAFKTGPDGNLSFNLSKLLGFSGQKIPGRTETYGEADRRIREGARRAMRSPLSSAQAEKFQHVAVEPLIAGSDGLPAATFSTVIVGDSVRDSK